MKLIDADKLLEALKTEPQYLMEAPRSCKSLLTNIISNHHKKVIEVIEQQPTAFDVDKVISNIWDRSELIHIKHNCYDEVEDYIRVTDVTQIVREGGLDEYDRE